MNMNLKSVSVSLPGSETPVLIPANQVCSHTCTIKKPAQILDSTQLWFCLYSTGQWWIHFHRWKRHHFCRHISNKPKNPADQRTETNSSHSFKPQWKMVAGELKAPIIQLIKSINKSINWSIPYINPLPQSNDSISKPAKGQNSIRYAYLFFIFNFLGYERSLNM